MACAPLQRQRPISSTARVAVPGPTLVKVRAPFSAPAPFAAAKISMPGAVLGSVLAEWLITGHGLGHAMAYDVISSDYSNLWASIVTLLIVSLGLYVIVGGMENGVRGVAAG